MYSEMSRPTFWKHGGCERRWGRRERGGTTSQIRTTVIGHDIGGKYIPIMARLTKGQTLE